MNNLCFESQSFVTSLRVALRLTTPKSFFSSTDGWYTTVCPDAIPSLSSTIAISRCKWPSEGSFHWGDSERRPNAGLSTAAFSTQLDLQGSTNFWPSPFFNSNPCSRTRALTSRELSQSRARPVQSMVWNVNAKDQIQWSLSQQNLANKGSIPDVTSQWSLTWF